MSIAKNQAIALLDPDSLCHSIYTELYNQFFNAQDKKSESHPYGVEEGDDTSIRLHNTAYGFAYAIAGAVEGGGSGGNDGGILLDYLRKDGGDMSGILRANYGFEAGIGNHRVLEAFSEENVTGVRIHGALDLHSSGMSIGGMHILSYDYGSSTLRLESDNLDFGDSSLRLSGDITFGSKTTGVYISNGILLVAGEPVYHKGNANLSTIDWAMKDGLIHGELNVAGATTLSGYLKSLYGAELGFGGQTLVSVREDRIDANAFLSFGSGYGIKISDILVLGRINDADIQLGGIGGDLMLGSEQTNKIRLMSAIMDADADYTLISPYGAAHFPDSLTVRHNYGDELLSSYRTSSTNEGIVIHKLLRFGTSRGPYLQRKDNGIAFCSFTEYTSPGKGEVTTYKYQTTFGHLPTGDTVSYEVSDIFALETDAKYFRFNKPVESIGYLGIHNSLTRLTDGSLFFSEDSYLLSATDGIKHFGNTYILGDISSELFSSGFAGSGWAIQRNKTTGNTSATFDEITVRKRMNVYELMVRKMSATNGSLWISDSCSGDRVERIH